MLSLCITGSLYFYKCSDGWKYVPDQWALTGVTDFSWLLTFSFECSFINLLLCQTVFFIVSCGLPLLLSPCISHVHFFRCFCLVRYLLAIVILCFCNHFYVHHNHHHSSEIHTFFQETTAYLFWPHHLQKTNLSTIKQIKCAILFC